jgi:hypothetical protein
MLDGNPMFAKMIADRLRQFEVVFHQQDVHCLEDYATAGANAWRQVR